MAFPTIQTADTKNGTVTTNSNSWTLTYPTNLASGDLIVAMAAVDGNPGAVTWQGAGGIFSTDANVAANLINVGPGACFLTAGAKISDGTETGTFAMPLGASEQGGWRVFRITGWFGSGMTGDGIIANQTTTGSPSLNPDAPSLNPTNWDVEDTLWITIMGCDTSRTVSSFPTNASDNRSSDVSGGSGGATLGVATANSATAAFNASAWTISNSDDWAAGTIGIRPAAGGGGTTYTKTGFGRESA